MPSKIPDSVTADGRPIGGLAMFIRKSFATNVSILCESENYMVAKIQIGDYFLDFLNIYMPCDCRTAESLVSYQNVLGELQALFENLTGNIILAGDFNADRNKGRFWSFFTIFYKIMNLS